MQRGMLSLRCLAALAGIAASVACSSGGSSGGNSSGQFIDSPVQGLRYVGPTYSGVTDANGRYSFKPGEEVCFYLGQLELGCAEGRGVLTPLDLVPGYRSDDDPTLNIVRLLMSLDADGDPSNGLDVRGVPDTATGEGIDFMDDLDDFENDQDARDFIAAYGPADNTGDLVDTEDADDHFQNSLEDSDYFEQQLAGTWQYTAFDEGVPTDANDLLIRMSDLDALEADVSEDGEVEFTLARDGESCPHYGYLNGLGRPRGFEINAPIEIEEGAETIYGDYYCGPQGPETLGLVQEGYLYFRMDKLDPEVSYSAEDLLGDWYLMTGEGSQEIYFDEEDLTELAGSIDASGAVNFTAEREYVDEQEQELVEDCSYSGQMVPDKYFMSGTYSCPVGGDGVWSAEMSYFLF